MHTNHELASLLAEEGQEAFATMIEESLRQRQTARNQQKEAHKKMTKVYALLTQEQHQALKWAQRYFMEHHLRQPYPLRKPATIAPRRFCKGTKVALSAAPTIT